MTQDDNHEGPIVHDRRRIDPITGKLRDGVRPAGGPSEPGAEPGGQPGEAPAGAPDQLATDEAAAEIATLRRALDERTNDIKRLQAEYVNYKRRVERDREAVRELAIGAVLTELLPVVDDIGRAREHGELEGGFKAVAEALEGALTKLGLARFGEVGDAFDPRVHEALMHAYSDDVDGPTCSAILQPGYRQGERVLRPARVAVAEPTVGLPADRPAAETDDVGVPAGGPAATDADADVDAEQVADPDPDPGRRPSEGDE